MLPVTDAIFRRNNIVKAFFDNDPTNSWKAKSKIYLL